MDAATKLIACSISIIYSANKQAELDCRIGTSVLVAGGPGREKDKMEKRSSLDFCGKAPAVVIRRSGGTV